MGGIPAAASEITTPTVAFNDAFQVGTMHRNRSMPRPSPAMRPSSGYCSTAMRT
jgi:hypothetical protein